MNETPLKLYSHAKQGQPKTPAPGTVAERVRQTVDRLNLDEGQAAAYFGVPVFTVRKWCTGEREPGAAVARLLEVLGLVEVFAPALHGSFLPPVSTTPPRKPGQVKKLAREIDHVEKSDSTGSTVSGCI
jgi:DNA-binding transcriptional regulator YiaG